MHRSKQMKDKISSYLFFICVTHLPCPIYPVFNNFLHQLQCTRLYSVMGLMHSAAAAYGLRKRSSLNHGYTAGRGMGLMEEDFA